MSKKLSKEDLDNLIVEFNAICVKIKPNDILSSINYMAVDLPNFCQRIYAMGFNAGFEIAKTIKVEELIKGN